MTDKRRSDTGWGKLALAVGALAVVTLVCGFKGWMQQAPAFNLSGIRSVENAAYLALRAFPPDSIYADEVKVGGNPLLIVARWAGLVVFASGLIAAFAALTRTRWIHWRLSLHKGHTLIVGDHPIVGALLRASRGKGQVVHMSRHAETASRDGGLITVPRDDWDDVWLRGRAHLASRVVIAETDVGQSAETVLLATAWLKAGKARDTSVRVHLDDPVAAEGFHHAEAGDVFTFCQAQAAARAVLDAHPPFHLARQRGAAAIHILLLGFGRLAEAILRDMVLNNVSHALGKPMVTVLDADAAAEAAFNDRNPEIHNACEVRFRTGPFRKAMAGLAATAANGEPRVCAAYVCFDRASDAFAAAIALREHAQTSEAFTAPIFVNLASGGGLTPFLRTRMTDALPLVGFGKMDEAVRAAGILADDPDEMARSVHKAYEAIAQHIYEPGLAKAWETLPEELRVSNRRVVTHILAKLDSLDFDIEPWLDLPPAHRPHPPALHPEHKMFRGQADKDMAAELEHRRWMTDRWVNGWRYGEKTDRAHKIHADLVPFDELPEKVRDFDYQVMDWLDGALPRHERGLRRRP